MITSPIDQPNKLYLGRVVNAQTRQPLDEQFMLTMRELTTHAVCLGMTGTGKTGLGITMIEEALLQGVPTIIIDPKGDLTNLLLTFPSLAANEFKPWIDAPTAAQQKQTVAQLAERAAKQWRDGLAQWDVPPERVARLADRADVRVYTPGSEAGVLVNVLSSLAPPRENQVSWARQSDVLRDRIAQTVTALLELLGIDRDPLQSREHILLSTIFESAWRAQQPLDVPLLIRMVQEPPVTRVGEFDLEAFFPKGDRFDLAMRLNNLAASPSFQAWQTGEPIDMFELTKPIKGVGGSNPMGKTRASIFYLAHLDEAERRFFTTLLLAHLVTWMRAQGGTSVLRCLVYFDEVSDYCPPFPANPATKAPLMALLKLGRAAGMGVVLAAQNPAALDYQGLSSVGTWFVGRLRAERDRQRVLDGLEGAGIGIDRAELDGPLTTLPQRVFLAQSVTGDSHFFQTRWSMNYLRGPLTVGQISGVGEQRGWRAAAASAHEADTRVAGALASAPPSTVERPIVESDVKQVFLHLTQGALTRVYRPHLLASATARITDRANGVMQDQRFTYLITLDRFVRAPDFGQATQLRDFKPQDAELAPRPGIGFSELPPGVTSKWLRQCERLLGEHVYRYAVATVFINRPLRIYGKPGETKADFRQRLDEVARVRRDAEASRVRSQFDRRIAQLQERLARDERDVNSERKELDARRRDEMLAGIEAGFSFVLGHHRSGGRAASYGTQKRRQTIQAENDLLQNEDGIEQMRFQIQQATRDYQIELSGVSDRWSATLNNIEEVSLVPRKSDIFADVVALAWVA